MLANCPASRSEDCEGNPYQSAHEPQNTSQEQPHGSDNLHQRLQEPGPQRFKLLLGIWHLVNLLLGIVNSICDRS